MLIIMLVIVLIIVREVVLAWGIADYLYRDNEQRKRAEIESRDREHRQSRGTEQRQSRGSYYSSSISILLVTASPWHHLSSTSNRITCRSSVHACPSNSNMDECPADFEDEGAPEVGPSCKGWEGRRGNERMHEGMRGDEKMHERGGERMHERGYSAQYVQCTAYSAQYVQRTVCTAHSMYSAQYVPAGVACASPHHRIHS
jgi:hypothetical protein